MRLIWIVLKSLLISGLSAALVRSLLSSIKVWLKVARWNQRVRKAEEDPDYWTAINWLNWLFRGIGAGLRGIAKMRWQFRDAYRKIYPGKRPSRLAPIVLALAIGGVTVTPFDRMHLQWFAGNTYYVDFASGADTNNGTSAATPFKHCHGDAGATDTAAASHLAPGDIVYFRKGVTYSGVISVDASGTSGNVITFGTTSWGTGTYATIDCGGTDYAINMASNDWLCFDGLKVIGNAFTTAHTMWGIGTDAGGTDGVEVKNCYFQDLFGESVRIRNGSYCSIHHNYFTGNQKGSGNNYNCEVTVFSTATLPAQLNTIHHNEMAGGLIDAIVIHNKYVDVYDNIIHGYASELNHGDGVVVNGTAAGSGTLKIYNNLIWDCGQYIYLDPILTGRTVSYVYVFNNVCYETDLGRVVDAYNTPVCFCIAHGSGGTAAYIYIENNTFVDGSFGVSLGGFTGDHIYVRNNVFSQMLYSTDRCVYWASAGTKTDIYFDYNQYQHHASGTDVKYGSTDLAFAAWQGTPYSQEANGQEGSPLFTSRATHDLHLTATSPCIGQATSVVDGGYTNDKDGVPRGAAWDMGAYEFVSSDAPSSLIVVLQQFWQHIRR
ncbi:MAG: right-handed parallel beta-helix repeat-containing protein [Armatimonadetes bacterium]|nr:right-handed parallel beta-helix repeat-containing protein [Armatimonadota bacterium]